MIDAPTNRIDSPIQFPLERTLYRVHIADDLVSPQTRTTIMLRGCHSLFDAMTKAQKSPGFLNFSRHFPNAQIIAAEFGGVLEN